MSKRNRSNQNFDPNMLLILLLILNAYRKKTLFNYKSNDVSRTDTLGYTGSILSEENNLPKEENYNESNNSIEEQDDCFEESSRYTNNSLNEEISTHEDKNKLNETDTGINNGISEEYETDMANADNRSSDDDVVGSKNNVLSEENDSNHNRDSNRINNSCEKDNACLINSSSDDVNNCCIVSGEVVPEYPNKLIMPNAQCNQIVVSVPVLLSQFETEFICETTFRLDCPATDINSTRKNVVLDECWLLPKVNKLFLSGIVRENIEYSTERNLRHITVAVPFKCATEVKYLTPPVINSSDEYLEIPILKSDGMEVELSERTYISSEHFNEKIYCKLVSDEITELQITNEDKGERAKLDCDSLFETLAEKMVVKVTLKLLQEQQISIYK